MAEVQIGSSPGFSPWSTSFNIFINDLLQESEVCNFANDTTIYTFGKILESVAFNLEEDQLSTVNWFGGNYMADNLRMYQLFEEFCRKCYATN